MKKYQLTKAIPANPSPIATHSVLDMVEIYIPPPPISRQQARPAAAPVAAGTCGAVVRGASVQRVVVSGRSTFQQYIQETEKSMRCSIFFALAAALAWPPVIAGAQAAPSFEDPRIHAIVA